MKIHEIFDWFYPSDTPETEARMETCRACPHFEPKFERCSKCGCFMRFKTTIPNAECPIGKWKSLNRKEGDIQNG